MSGMTYKIHGLVHVIYIDIYTRILVYISMVIYVYVSGKRESSSSRSARAGPGRVRTYDELIEGTEDNEIAFPDDLDLEFEIPKEVEEFEL